MSKRGMVLFGVLAGGILSLSTGCDPTGRKQVNLEEAKAVAKDRVYPALVFVKPIQESFEGGEIERMEVYGSGVIIDANGYVVTNNHVAEKAIEVNCVLGDKEQVPAVVVGLDPETDLALLKLELPEGHAPLAVARFGDSDRVEEGQVAMALGSPFGFQRSISQGIVSNTRRYLGFSSQHRFNLWFQTDAPINPGNSGGPLVDINGRIIGINTLGMGGYADGIGFSIPSNVVKDVISRLRARAENTDPNEWPVKVQRAYTGLQLQALNDFNSNTFTNSDHGVLVRSVDSDSPAMKAGLLDGDILLLVGDRTVEGQYVENLPAIERMLADLSVDDPVGVVVARKTSASADANVMVRESGASDEAGTDPNGSPALTVEEAMAISDRVKGWDLGGRKVETFTLTPIIRGKFEGEDFDCKRWNMTVKEISQYKNPTLHYFQPEGGVYIQGVRYPGNASDAGLNEDDVILKIGDTPVKTLDDVRKAYEALVNDKKLVEKKVLITIKRHSRKNWIVLDWSKDYLKEE